MEIAPEVDVSQDEVIREIHAAGPRTVIAVTGGGSGAISALLRVPGASRSVLAAAVPYSEAALVEWLGARPDEFCSPWTARAMAMAAFSKAKQYDPAAATCGLACTASLASDRPKRGAHRAHVAFQTASTTATVSVELEKGRRSRAEEEDVVAALAINHLAAACGIAKRVPCMLTASEEPEARQVVAPQNQQDLLAGRTLVAPLRGEHAASRPRAVFPGAFHPLHDAHRKMASVAGELLGADVAYEISIENVAKPPIDFVEIDERGRQFAAGEQVWLTRAPHFTQKAELFPGATFVVGADTIKRIAESRFYGNEPAARDRAIDQIAALGCRFLVFARIVDGKLCTLDDLSLPAGLLNLCDEVPASQFREDISSTQLRAAKRSE